MRTVLARHPHIDSVRDPRPSAVSVYVLIAWVAHLLAYTLVCALVLVVAGVLPAVILALAWGIGVASHGLFTLAVPILRRRVLRPAAMPAAQAPAARSAEPVRAPAPADAAERERARSLQELSAAIAHEIRSPITAAKSLVQQIAEDPSAPESIEHAQVAIAELDRVERSISHLLRFAREEPFEPALLELGELIESALEMVRDRAGKQQVRIECELDPLPQLLADREQLRKVIVNLLGNALDAHANARPPVADPLVHVAAGRNLAGDEVWIRVRDNGPGISAQVLSRIFRPFYTTKQGGTGLGLALARKIMDRHGGSIEVESNEGRGTEFVLSLPLRARGAQP